MNLTLFIQKKRCYNRQRSVKKISGIDTVRAEKMVKHHMKTAMILFGKYWERYG